MVLVRTRISVRVGLDTTKTEENGFSHKKNQCLGGVGLWIR